MSYTVFQLLSPVQIHLDFLLVLMS